MIWRSPSPATAPSTSLPWPPSRLYASRSWPKLLQVEAWRRASVVFLEHPIQMPADRAGFQEHL